MDALTRFVEWLLRLLLKPRQEQGAPEPPAPEQPAPIPQPERIPESLPTLDVLARTLWGEARGQGVEGMTAVACVIVNRAHEPGWWGTDIRSVCLKPMQFSCWNADDPQYKLMHAVTIMDAAYRVAVDIAGRALAGTLKDITNGSDHYCTTAVHPAWQRGQTPVYQYGTHLFYRLGLGA